MTPAYLTSDFGNRWGVTAGVAPLMHSHADWTWPLSMRAAPAAAVSGTVRTWRSGVGRVCGDRFYLLDYSQDLPQHLKVRYVISHRMYDRRECVKCFAVALSTFVQFRSSCDSDRLLFGS